MLGYIDPGSGSFLFQALIAFALATGLTVKRFWWRLRDWVLRRGPGGDSNNTP